MIDIRLLLDDFEATARRLVRRGVDADLLESARRLATVRREKVRQVDEARAEMNAGASRVGTLKRQSQHAEADLLRAELAELKLGLDRLEEEQRVAQADLDDVVMRIPNLPADDVPDGKSEADNVILRTHGYNPADYEGRTWAPHWEVAERLGIYDGERAAKLSGAMFSLLRGDGARLLARPRGPRAGLASGHLRGDRPTPPGSYRSDLSHRASHQI